MADEDIYKPAREARQNDEDFAIRKQIYSRYKPQTGRADKLSANIPGASDVLPE